MINELEYKEYQRMKINQAKRKRDQYVKRMSRIWRAKGEKLRKIREGLCISRHEIAQTIGAADSVLMRLETGGAIQRRPVIEQSYKMAIELIQYKRREAAGLI